jgi:ArsR family transcriptional regulator
MSTRTAPDLRRAVGAFHALSDPTRLELIGLLRKGERCVCELQEALGAAQSRLSFHLKVLKEAGLVTDRREGRWVYYALDRETVESLADVLTDCCNVQRGWLKGSCCVPSAQLTPG